MSRAQLDMLRVGEATFIKAEFRKLVSYLDSAYNSCHKFRDEVRPAYLLNDSRALQLYFSVCNCSIIARVDGPGKVVGSATPNADELEQDRLSWSLTKGLTFVISKPIFYDGHDWEHNLEFSLTSSSTSLVRLPFKHRFRFAPSNVIIDHSLSNTRWFLT